MFEGCFSGLQGLQILFQHLTSPLWISAVFLGSQIVPMEDLNEMKLVSREFAPKISYTLLKT